MARKKAAAARALEQPAGKPNPMPLYPQKRVSVTTHTPDYICRMCGHRHSASAWQHQLDNADGDCAACGSDVVTIEGDPKYVWPKEEEAPAISDPEPK